METVNLAGLIQPSTATYTGNVLAIYSPQPLSVDIQANVRIKVEVSCARTGRTLNEVRSVFPYSSGSATRYKTEFELSRMLQLVCDVEGVLSRVSYNGSLASIGEDITVKVYSFISNTWHLGATINGTALYAACDWGETIGADTEARRLFVNYPQTVRVSSYDGEMVILTTDNETETPYDGQSPAALELDIMQWLMREIDSDYDSHLEGLNPPIRVKHTPIIAEGQGDIENEFKTYALKDDLTPMGKGVYLRWLHRDGSVGYWLFTKSKEAFSATAGSSYTAYMDGVPAAPVAGTIRNAARQDFDIATTLTIGTPNATEDEHRYLCGLVSSPCVEMLVGGTRTAPVWARVNVVAGTYTRDYPRSGLPRLKPFELAITLPSRNAIKL